ncbi:MAG: putative Ig domain-containing protein, partial [Planctomycetes bacterium]|nr:putative Ig domain-containing protein [Planctomycetota bacterium]
MNISDPASFAVSWTITPIGAAGFLSFSSSDGAAVSSAIGAQVTAFAINNPATAARYRIDAVATSATTSLSAALQIEVQPDPLSTIGESTALSVNPFADPAVGYADAGGVNQITLFAGDSGPLSRVAFLWEPIDPGSLPAGLALPPVVDRDNATLILTVTDPEVTGIFPFRVTVTDAGGSIQTGVVNVYLGITDLVLDVQVRQVLPSTLSVTLGTIRAGGVSDLTAGTDDAFTYDWDVFDASNAAVAVTVEETAHLGQPLPITLDGNSLNWLASGFPSTGTYRLVCTVTDRVGNITSNSTTVVVDDQLAVTAAASQNIIGAGTAFFLRTVRAGGSAAFTYSFQVLNSAGADVTAGTGLSTTNSNNVTNDWPINALAADTYHFRVLVRDGSGVLAVAIATVDVVDDLTLHSGPSRDLVGVGQGFSLRTVRAGGSAPFTYSFAVFDSTGANVTGATGLAAAPNNNAQIDWAVAGLAAGTYRFFTTVSDADSREASSSAVVHVGDPLGASVIGATALTAPGVPVRFIGRANGGVAPYSFVFTAEDAEGDNPAGDVFSPVSVVGTDGTVTYVSSSSVATLALGAYRIRATVTDALGNTAIGAAPLYVTHDLDLVASARILNPPAAQLDLSVVEGAFENGPTGDGLRFFPLGGAAATLNFIPETPDPALAVARNLTLSITDDDTAGLTVNSVTFIGVNQRGEVVTDSIANPATDGSTLAVLDFRTPFKRLDRVTIDYNGAAAQDRIEIGIGEFFGLPRPFTMLDPAAADRAFTIVATGAGLDANPENATFNDPSGAAFETSYSAVFRAPDWQSVRFPGLVPNGTNDYIVQYVPLTSMDLVLDTDALLLDVSNGDT